MSDIIQNQQSFMTWNKQAQVKKSKNKKIFKKFPLNLSIEAQNILMIKKNRNKLRQKSTHGRELNIDLMIDN